jgi:hypothetical protein
LSEDIGERRPNQFQYCNNDPINKTDRTGAVEESDIQKTLEGMWSWFKDLGPAQKGLVVYLIAKFVNKAEKVAVGWLYNALGEAADALIGRSYQLFLAGAAEFAYGSSGGSMGQALGWGLKGATDMVAGVAGMSLGITLKYSIIMLQWGDIGL